MFCALTPSPTAGHMCLVITPLNQNLFLCTFLCNLLCLLQIAHFAGYALRFADSSKLATNWVIIQVLILPFVLSLHTCNKRFRHWNDKRKSSYNASLLRDAASFSQLLMLNSSPSLFSLAGMRVIRERQICSSVIIELLSLFL